MAKFMFHFKLCCTHAFALSRLFPTLSSIIFIILLPNVYQSAVHDCMYPWCLLLLLLSLITVTHIGICMMLSFFIISYLFIPKAMPFFKWSFLVKFFVDWFYFTVIIVWHNWLKSANLSFDSNLSASCYASEPPLTNHFFSRWQPLIGGADIVL